MNAEQFQKTVAYWMFMCFGAAEAKNVTVRNQRFLEEALELVQACDCTASEAHQLVDYVFSRPAGAKGQEVGGVMVGLAGLCHAQGIEMHAAADIELTRIWGKIFEIRARHSAKPTIEPQPESPPPPREPSYDMLRAGAKEVSQVGTQSGFPESPEAMESARLIWKGMYDAWIRSRS
jgi:hypothetical protein